jgi:hypothetical protein
MLTPLSKPLWDDPQKALGFSIEVYRGLLRQPGYLEELIGPLLLLASEAGSFITSQAIYAEGGWLVGTSWAELRAE